MKTASVHFSFLCTQLALTMLLACSNTPATPASVDNAPLDADSEPTPERAIEVFEAGDGDTTVVFEAGLGNDWTSWEPVAREISAEARVFAYSRPGYGHSEPSEETRDAEHIVDELRALLASHGYAPPYVLVGHSFGGAYMELFAKAHPEEVVGLVLVDPRHRDFSAACEESGFDGCKIPDAVVATLPPVQLAEYEDFEHTSDEIRAAGSFGSYPVRVLTATSHGFAPEVETLWQSMLKSLADEATDGEQKLFPGAGHNLQVELPHEVAAAVLSLVSDAR